MDELDTFQKIEAVLFKGRSEASLHLTNTEMKQKERWMICVSRLLENPTTTDQELNKFLCGGCGGVVGCVSQGVAYRDIASIRLLVGNIKLATKNWYRYLIIESCKRGIKIAEANNDAKGIAACADKIGKYTLADQNDNDVDRSQWQPPVFEPSDDITLLGDGFKKIPNLEEKRKSLRELFEKEIVEYVPEDAKK